MTRLLLIVMVNSQGYYFDTLFARLFFEHWSDHYENLQYFEFLPGD